jgi:hypothetical protein
VVDVSAVLEQRVDNVKVSFHGRDDERREASAGRRVLRRRVGCLELGVAGVGGWRKGADG